MADYTLQVFFVDHKEKKFWIIDYFDFLKGDKESAEVVWGD